MTIRDLLRVLKTLCIATLLSCTILVKARQYPQDDFYSRSAEHDSQSYDFKSRSVPSRQVKDPQDNFYSGSYNSRSTEGGSQSHRVSEQSQSASQGYYE